jgi:hypothetical protein
MGGASGGGSDSGADGLAHDLKGKFYNFRKTRTIKIAIRPIVFLAYHSRLNAPDKGEIFDFQ